MNTYVVIFGVPAATMKEWMASVDEATRTKQIGELMASWTKWFEDNAASISDRGMPLGKTKRVTKESIEDIVNDLNYYIVVKAESHESAAELMQTCPHLEIPMAFMEVMAVSNPGM